MRKEEFYFDSRDNATKIHAVKWTPDTEEVRAVIQIVHGMTEHVERYEHVAAFLTARNFVVVGEDHLGHGKSVPEGGVRGYFCEQDPATVVVRDVHRLKKMTEEQYPGVPYFIMGHSMGSFITRNYIARYGTGIKGAIILGTGMQSGMFLTAGRIMANLVGFFRGQKYVSKLLNSIAFGSYNKRIKPSRTGSDWLTKDEKVVDAYIADKDCGFIFTVNGFKTLSELIRRAKDPKNLEHVPKSLPLYLAAGTEDPVGDYGKGVQKTYDMYRRYGMEELSLKMYEGDRHELHNETDKDVFMQDLVAWISKHLAG